MPVSSHSLNGLTGQEVEALQKHFNDPEFCRLFAEYAKEISSPEAQAENEAYLQQIEAEGRVESVYGPGVQLVVPQPGFVIKTKDAVGRKRVYINICTSDKVGKMELKTGSDSSNKQGSRPQVLLPMMLRSQPQDGAAVDGGQVVVWDLVVHPEAIITANDNPEIRHMLVTMAIERVEEASCKLLRLYKLPHMTYKSLDGGCGPTVMAVRTTADGEVVNGRLRPMANSRHGHDTTAKGNHKQNKTWGSSKFSFGNKLQRESAGRAATAAIAAAAPPESAACPDSTADPSDQHPGGAVTPSWQLIERSRVDLGSTWQDTGRTLQPHTTQPEALLLRVQLPGVASAGEVQIDVSSDSVELCVPQKYLLNVKFQYQVQVDRSTAKFNKAKQQLELALPTVARMHQPCSEQEQQQQQETEEKAKCAAMSSSSLPTSQLQDDQPIKKLQQQQQPPVDMPPVDLGMLPGLHNSSITVAEDKQAEQQQQRKQEQAMQQPQHSHNAPTGTNIGIVVSSDDASNHAAAVVGVSLQQVAKSDNQKRWEELHSQFDSQMGLRPVQQYSQEQQVTQPLHSEKQLDQLQLQLAGGGTGDQCHYPDVHLQGVQAADSCLLLPRLSGCCMQAVNLD